MTRTTWALLLGAPLSSPAVLRWLRGDLSGADALLRFGIATALAAGVIQLLTTVVSAYRPEPVPGDRRRSDDDPAEAARS